MITEMGEPELDSFAQDPKNHVHVQPNQELLRPEIIIEHENIVQIHHYNPATKTTPEVIQKMSLTKEKTNLAPPVLSCINFSTRNIYDKTF